MASPGIWAAVLSGALAFVAVLVGYISIIVGTIEETGGAAGIRIAVIPIIGVIGAAIVIFSSTRSGTEVRRLFRRLAIYFWISSALMYFGGGLLVMF